MERWISDEVHSFTRIEPTKTSQHMKVFIAGVLKLITKLEVQCLISFVWDPLLLKLASSPLFRVKWHFTLWQNALVSRWPIQDQAFHKSDIPLDLVSYRIEILPALLFPLVNTHSA